MKLRNPFRKFKPVDLGGWPAEIVKPFGFVDRVNDAGYGFGSDNGAELVAYWMLPDIPHGDGACVATCTDGVVLISPTPASIHAATVDPSTWTGSDARLWNAVANAPDRPAGAVVEVWDWRDSDEI